MSMIHNTVLLVVFVLFMCAPTTPASGQVGTCTVATAASELNIGNVRAGVSNDNWMFWLKGAYQVPKDGPDIMFSAMLWLNGEVNGFVRQSAGNYSQRHFWAGPLDDAGAPPLDCARYDSIWTVSVLDIEALEAGVDTTNSIRNWPTGLGAPTIDATGMLVDVSGFDFEQRDSVKIDLDAGQRPAISGHQMSWWVMNDLGNSDSGDFAALGVEVQVSAMAFSTADALSNTTIYRYDIINRSAEAVSDFRIGFHIDPDLGEVFDDYVGSDSTLGLGYVYNSVDTDSTSYISAMPAIGAVALESPGAVASILPLPSVGGSGDSQRWRLMHGLRHNGLPYRSWGDGHSTDTTKATTRFIFWGDPPNFWSEPNSGDTTNTAGDRNVAVTTGPADLTPGATATAAFGLVWSRGADNIDSVTKLKTDAGFVKNRYAATNGFRDMVAFVGVESDETGAAAESSSELQVTTYPNPTRGSLKLVYELQTRQAVTVDVFDVLGRRVQHVLAGNQHAGRHELPVQLNALPRGVYFARVRLVETAATAVAAIVLE